MSRKKYKSKFESRVASVMRKSGVRFVYEPESWRFVQPEIVRKYTPDFRIESGGRVFFVEAKGKLTAEDRKKLLWVRESNPKFDLVLLFMNPDVRLSRRSPTTYGAWATKVGFRWFDFRKGIPKEWVTRKKGDR